MEFHCRRNAATHEKQWDKRFLLAGILAATWEGSAALGTRLSWRWIRVNNPFPKKYHPASPFGHRTAKQLQAQTRCPSASCCKKSAFTLSNPSAHGRGIQKPDVVRQVFTANGATGRVGDARH
ncbi:hypothetical protein [Leisingera sp. S232]|uniref:hypothetical protein n=1 Tax=Leisingera sp. S232 TaxID=3415132 RepID=UPI003C7DCA6A